MFILVSACKQDTKQTTTKKMPNVLFIAVDDLRPELGIYGNKIIHSPNIDQLGRDGVIFEQAYVQQALCAPSRASVMTGLRPQTTKVQTLWDKLRDSIPDAVTMPQYFAQKGYTTTAIGKMYHNTDPDPASWSEPKLYLEQFPFNPECIYASQENLDIQKEKLSRPPKAGNKYERNKPDRFGHYYVRANFTEMADVPDETFYDGAQTLVAIDKLEQLAKADKPFFFGLGFYRPHSPYISPKKYWDLYDRESIPMAENPFIPEGAPDFAVNTNIELKAHADFTNAPTPLEGSISEADARRVKHGYYAAVSYTDAQVGKVIKKLKDLGLYDETIIVLWSDHGYKLGEHNGWSKFTNYNIDTHAPLIIKSNRTEDNKHRVAQMVEMIDIYPTLCEMMGLEIPTKMEGMSLLPHISKSTTVGKEAIFSSYRKEHHWSVPRGNEQLGNSILTKGYHYVKWQSWKDKSFTAEELYDLKKDPLENKNVAALPEYEAIVKQMKAQLEAGWQAEQEKVKHIIALNLSALTDEPLPSYAAGAHIDVQIREGLVRQYSLCQAPNKVGQYRIGVLLDPNSKGGSKAIHAQFTEGTIIRIGQARNHFPLAEKATHSILLAGGIGITPMLAMAYELQAKGQSFEVHYCARSRNKLAFVDELQNFGKCIHFHLDDEQRMDVSAVLGIPKVGHQVYCCGPNGFMEFIVDSTQNFGWAESQIHVEHFGAEVDTNGQPFMVIAKKSGIKLVIEPGQTIANELIKQGIHVPMSCQTGVCGTCITKVIDGKPDHRDMVLTDAEKAANNKMTLCCSRSKNKQLILEI